MSESQQLPSGSSRIIVPQEQSQELPPELLPPAGYVYRDSSNPQPEVGPYPRCCCVACTQREHAAVVKVKDIKFQIPGCDHGVLPTPNPPLKSIPAAQVNRTRGVGFTCSKFQFQSKSSKVGVSTARPTYPSKPSGGPGMSSKKMAETAANSASAAGSASGVMSDQQSHSGTDRHAVPWNSGSVEHDSMPKNSRAPLQRIFVNRGLHLEKICFFGFDMDYTLAVYQSPLYESIMFKLIVSRLVSIGYPEVLLQYEYDPSFPVRGLWFDSKYGTLLKMDPYGNILVAMKGFSHIDGPLLLQLYPNKFLQFDDNRIYIMNTLFNLPELYLLACIVQYFSENSEYIHDDKTGVKCGDLFMSYKSILQDVRDAVDYVHIYGTLKEITLSRLSELVVRDDRLPTLLDRIRLHGGKTFLLTNSKYDYTSKVMSYMLDGTAPNGEQRVWSSYFDYVVVDANKPRFFAEGNTLREIDPATGEQKIGVHTGPLKHEHVYSGGSCDVFSQLIGARGKDVLYVGDHIFGDILKSKKIRGWRTFLVVPEMTLELYVWTSRKDWYLHLEALETQLKEAYMDMDSTSTQAPDTSHIQEQIRQITHQIDLEYGMFGSLFSSGSRQSFFASQVIRFADLYSGTILNLINYPFFYLFKPAQMLMPHGSTVLHEEMSWEEEAEKRIHMRSRSVAGPPFAPLPQQKAQAQEPRHGRPRAYSLIAETPKTIMHHHDDDSDDSVVNATVASAADDNPV